MAECERFGHIVLFSSLSFPPSFSFSLSLCMYVSLSIFLSLIYISIYIYIYIYICIESTCHGLSWMRFHTYTDIQTYKYRYIVTHIDVYIYHFYVCERLNLILRASLVHFSLSQPLANLCTNLCTCSLTQTIGYTYIHTRDFFYLVFLAWLCSL